MMTAMVIWVCASGLDRIEGEGRSARAGSIGLPPEAMVMRCVRAGSIGLRVTVNSLEPARSDWLPRMLTSMCTGDPLEPARSD